MVVSISPPRYSLARLRLAKSRAIAGTIGAVAVFAANPAAANSSANADIAAPLRQAQAAKPALGTNGDEQFRKLFGNWQSLEQSGVPALAAVGNTAQAGRAYFSSAARVPAAVPFGGTFGGVISAMKSAIPSRTPLQGVHMTSDFGMRVHPILGGMRRHAGVDLAAPVGTPVYATADGVVGKAEWFGGYGLFVALEHGASLETRYGHMSRLNVAAGQSIHKGDIVGFVGTTGRSTGPHLHYEVRVAGAPVNPIPYMQSDDNGRSMARVVLAAASAR
ncbi:MAG: M23 family metallopeptidase [Novosphingobium sp.]